MSQPVDILLVEDNPHDIEITLHAFRKQNLTASIHVARDGEEALDFIFCKGKFAAEASASAAKPCRLLKLILLDLKLPFIDGLEVLRQIKSHPTGRRIPVVVLSSSREERDISASYELGANSYIVKPLDFDQFNEASRLIGPYWLKLNQPPVS